MDAGVGAIAGEIDLTGLVFPFDRISGTSCVFEGEEDDAKAGVTENSISVTVGFSNVKIGCSWSLA